MGDPFAGAGVDASVSAELLLLADDAALDADVPLVADDDAKQQEQQQQQQQQQQRGQRGHDRHNSDDEIDPALLFINVDGIDGTPADSDRYVLKAFAGPAGADTDDEAPPSPVQVLAQPLPPSQRRSRLTVPGASEGNGGEQQQQQQQQQQRRGKIIRQRSSRDDSSPPSTTDAASGSDSAGADGGSGGGAGGSGGEQMQVNGAPAATDLAAKPKRKVVRQRSASNPEITTIPSGPGSSGSLHAPGPVDQLPNANSFVSLHDLKDQLLEPLTGAVPVIFEPEGQWDDSLLVNDERSIASASPHEDDHTREMFGMYSTRELKDAALYGDAAGGSSYLHVQAQPPLHVDPAQYPSLMRAWNSPPQPPLQRGARDGRVQRLPSPDSTLVTGRYFAMPPGAPLGLGTDAAGASLLPEDEGQRHVRRSRSMGGHPEEIARLMFNPAILTSAPGTLPTAASLVANHPLPSFPAQLTPTFAAVPPQQRTILPRLSLGSNTGSPGSNASSPKSATGALAAAASRRWTFVDATKSIVTGRKGSK